MELATTTANLGKILAQARRRSRLTQQQLCAQTGIAYSTLTKIERGAIKKPNVFTVFQIAQATNLSIEDLLRNEMSAEVSVSDDHSSQSQSAVKPTVRFVYFDMHQVLVHGRLEFAAAAADLGVSLALMEHIFLKCNYRLNTGQMTIEEFEQALLKHSRKNNFSWSDVYSQAMQPEVATQDFCRYLTDKSIPVGLLTNTLPGAVETLLAAGKIPDFTIVIDSSKVGLMKPTTAMYRHAGKEAGVPASEILLIDDRPVNLLGARKEGWQVFCYSPDKASKLQQTLLDTFNFEL